MLTPVPTADFVFLCAPRALIPPIREFTLEGMGSGSPALDALRRCTELIDRYVALEHAIEPPADVVQRAEQLAADLTTLIDMAGRRESMDAAPDKITHILVTNAGLEGMAAAEAVEVTGAALVLPCPFGVNGYVGVGHLPPGGEDKLQNLRSIHDALKFHAHLALAVPTEGSTEERANQMLEDLCTKVTRIGSLGEELKSAESFRVRCERVGGMYDERDGHLHGHQDTKKKRVREDEEQDLVEQVEEEFAWGAAKVKILPHGFQSHQVERHVGGVLHEAYGVRADMKNFAVCVRVDVVMQHALVMTMGNVDMLSKRHKLAFVRSVTLKPNVAFVMIYLANFKAGQSLLDPFMGGGTIPLEAAAIYGRFRN